MGGVWVARRECGWYGRVWVGIVGVWVVLGDCDWCGGVWLVGGSVGVMGRV
jgi:hypothetical protein